MSDDSTYEAEVPDFGSSGTPALTTSFTEPVLDDRTVAVSEGCQ